MHHELEKVLCEIREFRTELFDILRIHQHRQNEILGAIRHLSQLEKRSMATLDDISADVADEATVIGSVVTLLANLKAQLDAAGQDPAKIDAIKAAIDSNKAALAALVVTGTPVADEAPAA